ncbi:hypothetical protein NA57DRAFT_77217 [Rhizodiscina lignyota]|uniref:Heterokaryon incompatibility protein n=1 Tax=Rhizodiscina lignyota TaxID=1504668 RepID=A0A9P4IC39_9PEZI|nr:hypothetical protein NA57DRAFT_77217 [Rhizodiscina lignyota]
MASIYRQSTLTLAATGSKDGTGGLFSDNPEYKLIVTGPNGKQCNIYARKHIRHFGYPVGYEKRYPVIRVRDDSQDFPLLGRGWVYQERLLSKRMLHFGSGERICECHEIHRTASDNVVDLMKTLKEGYMLPLGQPRKWTRETPWRLLVSQYSTLRLTFGKDKLPALSGCAQQVLVDKYPTDPRNFSAQESPYVAGLWRKSLLDDLLWSAADALLPRPEKWRAPSFSWASVDNVVKYPKRLSYQTGVEAEAEQYEPLCTVVGAEGIPSGIDITGAVRYGELRIRGILMKGILLHRPVHYLAEGFDGKDTVAYEPAKEFAYPPSVLLHEDKELFFSADYALHCPGPHHVFPGATIHVLRMQRPIDHNGPDYSLILRRVGEAQVTPEEHQRLGATYVQNGHKYERIGLADISGARVLDAQEKHQFRTRTEYTEVVII